jgi:dihydropteroate synthase-like protein
VKVLVITGKLAYPIVKEVVSGIKDVEVKALDYPVAALMSVRYILEGIKDLKQKYDVVLIPGLASGDAREIQERLGVKAYKGTESAWDIPLVLEALRNGVELSTVEPADSIIKELKERELERIEESLEVNSKVAFEAGIKVPLYPPPFRIFLELDPNWDVERIKEEVERTKDYVDVYVVGFPVGHHDLEEVRRKVKPVLDEGKVAGVDSESPRELIEGVKAGAAFAFNLNELNVEKLQEVRRESAFVVAPFTTEDRGDVTISLVKKAREMGFERLLADPVLSPPLQGLMDSLCEFKKVRKALADVPMLMGILNVTELIDADSHGVNALMTAIAGELGVANLLVMEKGKTKWSSLETRIASKMVSMAMVQKKTPKDVGMDLLILKDKRKVKEEEVKGEEVGYVPPSMDPSGFVKVSKAKDKLAVEFYGKKRIALTGTDALSLGRRLVSEVNVTPQHALYIGYELAKAEIALALDKNYIQDEPLFKRVYASSGAKGNKGDS